MRGAAAASSTYKVKKPAVLSGQSLKVSKRESSPCSRDWEETKSRWMRGSETEVLEEIVKMRRLQPHRLQDKTCECGVP